MTKTAACAELTHAVGQNDWFQRFEALPGVWTRGPSDMEVMLGRVGLPADMAGWSVLDIGTNDGCLAFESEARGAARVVAVDHPDAWGYGGAPGLTVSSRWRFDLVHAARGSKVEPMPVHVEEMTCGQVGGPFDLVLFLGVLYHIENPMRAMRNLREVVRPGGLLIVETHVALQDLPVPASLFYPFAEHEDDPSSWWSPNALAVIGMLKAVGFSDVTQPALEQPFNRAVFHAR